MAQPRVVMKFRLYAAGTQRFDSALHRTPRGDAVVFADAGVGRRVVPRVVGVSRVLHDDRGGTRQPRAAEGRGAVRAEPRRHARARRAAPERVTFRADAELLRVRKNHAYRAREILAGRLRARAVNYREGVVAHLREFERVGKAVVHRTDVCKAAARAAYGEWRAAPAAEEEQSRVAFARVGAFFGLRVNVDKDCVSSRGA